MQKNRKEGKKNHPSVASLRRDSKYVMNLVCSLIMREPLVFSASLCDQFSCRHRGKHNILMRISELENDPSKKQDACLPFQYFLHPNLGKKDLSFFLPFHLSTTRQQTSLASSFFCLPYNDSYMHPLTSQEKVDTEKGAKEKAGEYRTAESFADRSCVFRASERKHKTGDMERVPVGSYCDPLSILQNVFCLHSEQC